MKLRDLDRAARERLHQRRADRQRRRVILAVVDATPEPCPYGGYGGGAVCALDARKHYHLSARPGSGVEVVYYGSQRDQEHQASMQAYYDQRGNHG